MKRQAPVLALVVLSSPVHLDAPQQTAVFSAGCYWTVEAVFEHVRGVTNVVAGITGREAAANGYVRNTTGTTGGAEAAQVTFDPDKVTYEELLKVFFTAAHDPTSVDKQGPDVGGRYRSVLWVANEAQQKAALKAIADLESSKAFKAPIATQVATVVAFKPVPESEQDFVEKNPTHPYVVAWDRPRIAHFREVLPDLFVEHR